MSYFHCGSEIGLWQARNAQLNSIGLKANAVHPGVSRHFFLQAPRVRLECPPIKGHWASLQILLVSSQFSEQQKNG